MRVVAIFALYKYQEEKLKVIADRNYRSLANQLTLIIDEWLEKNENTKRTD